MATKTSTQDLSSLVINKVESQTAYDQMVAAGQINANELYLVEGDTIPSPYTSNPAMDGIASPGSSTSYAKGDHVHPSDTSRAPVSHATSTSTYGEGTGTNYGHLRLSDSTSSTSGTSGGYAATPSAVKSVKDSIPSASTTSPSMDGNASYGSGTTWARADHVHPTDTSRAPTSHSSSATTYGTGTSSNYGHVKLSDSTSSTSGVNGGVAATPAAVKSVMDSIPTVPTATATTPKMDGTAAVGSETQWAKGDHVHPTDTSRAPTSHATNATTYGAGTGTNYGHLRLSDSTSSTSSTSGGYAATPAAVKAAYDLANGKANTYSKTFTSTGWTSQTITVTASTHGCGTAPMVQVQRLNGSNYETYYGFPSTGWKVSIDSSGNVTLSVPASGDEFSGRLVIR